MEITSTLFAAKAIYIGLIFAITLGVAAYSTYGERIVAAWMQDRVGPDRAGPFGILQPLADAVKMFMKEDFIPANSSKWLFIAGPCLSMLTALLTSAVVPFGDKLDLGGGIEMDLQGIDVNIGILWVFGIVSLGVYGILVGGWASNNKYSLLGAIRAASQNISYELAMGLSIIAILMMTGSLSTKVIVETQQNGAGFLSWNIWSQPIGFIIFIVCAFAECNRTPFDLPECETELVGGFHTEYSAMKLGLFLFGEYVNLFISSAIDVPLRISRPTCLQQSFQGLTNLPSGVVLQPKQLQWLSCQYFPQRILQAPTMWRCGDLPLNPRGRLIGRPTKMEERNSHKPAFLPACKSQCDSESQRVFRLLVDSTQSDQT